MKITPPSQSNAHWLDRWHVSPSTNRDYDFLDGLRGVAILMVLVCHYIYVNPKAGPLGQFIGGLAMAGGSGVTLFFTLSGFLLSWPFWKRKFSEAAQAVPAGYGWRRFWKIYPPLALSVVLLTPLYVLARHDWSCFLIGAQWLVGLPFLFPVSDKCNVVMWSLVIEVHFYIVLPLLFICVKKIPAKFCLWALPLIFLVVPVGYRCITGLSHTIHPIINAHFPSALDAFALGVLIAGLETSKVMKITWAKLGLLGLVLLPLALLGSAWLHVYPESGQLVAGEALSWLVKIAAACLLCFVADPQQPVAKLLCAPWLRWCGIVSYELYLFHQPIVLWARQYFGPADGSLYKYALIIVGCLLSSLLLTAVVYRLYSLPILQYGRASAKQKKPCAPSV